MRLIGRVSGTSSVGACLVLLETEPTGTRWHLSLMASREKSMELLRIRASHPLLTLGSAEQIRRRVRFLPTGVNGADQPGVIAMHIDGRGQGESEEAGLFVLFNATPEEWAGTLQVWGKSRDFEVAPRSATVHADRN